MDAFGLDENIIGLRCSPKKDDFPTIIRENEAFQDCIAPQNDAVLLPRALCTASMLCCLRRSVAILV